LARNEAEQQRLRAEQEAETAQQTTSFMIDLFRVSDPGEARGRSITAREILMSGASRIEEDLAGQPTIQGRLLDTIGKVFTNLGLFEDASRFMELAQKRRQSVATEDHSDQARSLSNLAWVLREQSELERSEQLYQQCIALLENQLSARELQLDCMAGLAEVYFELGRYEDAEPVLIQVLAMRQELFGERHLAVADTIQELGLNQFDQGNNPVAEQKLREALALRRDILGPEPHPDLAENMNDLALVLFTAARYEETESLYLEVMEMQQILYGDEHPQIATTLGNVGQLYRMQGKLTDAAASYAKALKMQVQLLGEAHPDVARIHNDMAFIYADEGDLDKAIASMEKALSLRQAALGEVHPEVALTLSNLARWRAQTGDDVAARALYQQALEQMQALLDPEHIDVAIAKMGLAQLLTRSGELKEAQRLAKSSHDTLAAALGSDHWIAYLSLSVYGGVLSALGQYEEAATMLEDSYRKLQDAPGSRPTYIQQCRDRLAAHYRLTGQTDKLKSLG
jgi:tetratricopeptide (TPR) repeat protein